MDYVSVKLNSDTRIECYNTGCPERPVSLHVNGIRLEMPVAELLRFRAAMNQWLAENPKQSNGTLASH